MRRATWPTWSASTLVCGTPGRQRKGSNPKLRSWPERCAPTATTSNTTRQRLEEVEERLRADLQPETQVRRIHRGDLGFAEHAAEELDAISHHTERAEALQCESERLVGQAATLAADLSGRRREAGDRLATEIVRELADLRMERAKFEVAIGHAEAADGLPVTGPEDAVRYAFDETGYDQVEFLIAPNVGEPLRPLAKTASGGEAARLMLALKVVLSTVDPVPTLIFDEIDSGIGGRAGGVVGRKLWSLATDHQVLCVTHLPQIAAFADAHYRVAKQVQDGRTTTEVSVCRETRPSRAGPDAGLGYRHGLAQRQGNERAGGGAKGAGAHTGGSELSLPDDHFSVEP